MAQQLDKVLYTAHAHTTGGREGASRTHDGKLDIQLTPPGGSGTGTNPEQLFAAGYSACFIGALKAVAARQKISLPPDVSVDAEVDSGLSAQPLGLPCACTFICRAWTKPRRSRWWMPRTSLALFQRHARQHSRHPHD